jgi:hypothetical protein
MLARIRTGRKLGLIVKGRNGSLGVLTTVLLTLLIVLACQASASSVVSYALTTTTDPVKPGQVVQFKLTASNVTSAGQFLSVVYHVPQFTTAVGTGYAAGTALSYAFGSIAPGVSESVYLDFKVVSGTPDGSLMTLFVFNEVTGASVARTATVKVAPAAALDLSTQQGSVAPGGSFSYTLAYHNASSSTLSGSQLSLPIPLNTIFVSADGGGVKGTDGIVRWTPAALGAGGRTFKSYRYDLQQPERLTYGSETFKM